MKSKALVLAALCSCVVPDAEQLSDVEQPLKPNCDEWGCGMNSPYIDNYGFHFLYKNGATNPQGFSISQFENNGDVYTFRVSNGEITGSRPASPILQGQALVGAQLHIDQYGSPAYTIKITGVDRIPSWASTAIGGHFWVDTYQLEWTAPGQSYYENVCARPGVDDELGMNEFHTLLFEGDIIDAAQKTVAGTIDDDVVNFGCAGSALAKQHLTGHTEVARRLGFSTTTTERQANLKLFVADYCGDGTPYTVGGQPLQWADHRGWVSVSGAVAREALWTANGAACFNTPRIVANSSADTMLHFPTITNRDRIACAAHVPECVAGSSATLPDPRYHLVSSNPL